MKTGYVEMKKMLIISIGNGYGGAEKSLEVLADELIKEYHLTVCVENQRHKDCFLEKNNCTVIPFPKGKGLLDIFCIIKQLNEVLNQQFDIIITNTNKSAFVLAISSFFTKINMGRVCIYLRDFQWKFRHFICWRLRKAFFAIPTQALLDKNGYWANCIPKDNVVITGNAVHIQEYEPIYQSGKYFLTLANISRWKGIIYLIEAYHLSRLWEDNIPLVICGSIADEKYYQEIDGYIKNNGLTDFVRIEPFINDTELLYQNAKVVINSSICDYRGPETFGRTIIEAWKYKKPVISFNCGGPAYIVDDGVNGCLVPEKNIEELARLMIYFAVHEDACKSMGEAGFKKVKDFFTPEKIMRHLLQKFDDTIDA